MKIDSHLIDFITGAKPIKSEERGPSLKASELYVYVGKISDAGVDIAVNLGGGILIISQLSDDGINFIPLKRITSLTDDTDKASRFLLDSEIGTISCQPGSQLSCEASCEITAGRCCPDKNDLWLVL